MHLRLTTVRELALLALERVDEVFDVCARAGEGGPDDAKIQGRLRERAEKKRDELRRKEEEKGERTQRATGRRAKVGCGTCGAFSSPLHLSTYLFTASRCEL